MASQKLFLISGRFVAIIGAKLISDKKAAYAKYHLVRNEIKELLTVKANVDLILGVEPKKQREKSQER